MFKDNDISIYSIYNEGKSVVAEGFVRTLKNKIYRHMIAISKNVYFDVLDDIVDESNNCIRILQRNSKSVVRTYKWLNTAQ